MSQIIENFRKKYPVYNDFSNKQLAEKMYEKFYSKSMTREEYDEKIGVIDKPKIKPKIETQQEIENQQEIQKQIVSENHNEQINIDNNYLNPNFSLGNDYKNKFEQIIGDDKKKDTSLYFSENQLHNFKNRHKQPIPPQQPIPHQQPILPKQQYNLPKNIPNNVPNNVPNNTSNNIPHNTLNKTLNKTSMIDLISGKLNNIAKGITERTAHIPGSFLHAIDLAIKAGNDTFEGGLAWENDDIFPTYKTDKEMKDGNYETPFKRGASYLRDMSFGYKENVKWKDVKNTFTEKGFSSVDSYLSALEYGLEHALTSAPDILSMMFSLPFYIVVLSAEFGDERAKNKGKKETELIDVAESVPTAIASIALDRVGIKGITASAKEAVGTEILKAGYKHAIKRAGKATVKATARETVIEAVQEGMIEYVGQTYGTKKELKFAEALDRGLAGAVAGGVGSFAASSGLSSLHETVNTPHKILARKMQQTLDEVKFKDPTNDSIEALKPHNAQYTESTTKNKTKPEPDTTTETKTEPDTTTETKTEPDTTTETKTEPDTTTETKTEPDTTTETKTEPDTTTETKPEPDTTTETKPEPDTTTETKPEPDTTTETKPEPDTTTETKPEPDTTTETKPETDTTTETKPKPDTKTNPDTKTQTKPEPETTLNPKDIIENTETHNKLLVIADNLEKKVLEVLDKSRRNRTPQDSSQGRMAREEVRILRSKAKILRGIVVRNKDGKLKHLKKLKNLTQLSTLLKMRKDAIYKKFGLSLNNFDRKKTTFDEYKSSIEDQRITLESKLTAYFIDTLRKKKQQRYFPIMDALSKLDSVEKEIGYKKYASFDILPLDLAKQIIKIHKENIKLLHVFKTEILYKLNNQIPKAEMLKELGINNHDQLLDTIEEINDIDTKPETETTRETKPEQDTKTETKPQPDTKTDTKPQPDTKTDTKPQPDTKTDTKPQPETTLNPKDIIENIKTYNKLLVIADSLEKKSIELLNKDRNTNTPKRSRDASYAREKARSQIAVAQTLRSIAVRLKDGELKHLKKLKNLIQLKSILRIRSHAMYNKYHDELKKYGKGKTILDERRRTYNQYKNDVADKIKRNFDIYKSNIADQRITLSDKQTDQIIRELNINKKKYRHILKDLFKLDYVDKFLEKRNSYKDIQDRYIFPLDLSKQLIKLHKDKVINIDWIDNFKDKIATFDRLKKLGINNHDQLLDAIEELNSIIIEPKKESKIEILERELIGTNISGYFPTPKYVVDKMIDYAEINKNDHVLEPSAGKGNIADQLKTDHKSIKLDVIEVNYTLSNILKLKNYNLVGNDFLKFDKKKYDRIVMNPPFENHQDVEHIKHAYSLLKDGGIVVSLMGGGINNSLKKNMKFKDWLSKKDSYIEKLPDQSFKNAERSTGVSIYLVKIKKPLNKVSMSKDINKHNYKSFTKNDNKEIHYGKGKNHHPLHFELGLPKYKKEITIDGKKLIIKDKTHRFEPILHEVIKIVGRAVYYGRLKGNILGFYRGRNAEIRAISKNKVEVLAHEMAHYLDFFSNTKLPNFQQLYSSTPKIIEEVNGVSYTDVETLQQSEGFAEFVRLWLTNANEAKVRAPTFYKSFNELLETDKKLYKKMRNLQVMMHRYYFQGHENFGNTLIGDNKSVAIKFSNFFYRRHSLIRQQFIDGFHAARKIEQEITGRIAKGNRSPWKALRLGKVGAEGISDYILNEGTIKFINNEIKKTGKSLREVLIPIDKITKKQKHKNDQMIDLFMKYLAGYRSLELRLQNREKHIPKEITTLWINYENDYPSFKEIREDYKKFNSRMLDFYVSSELITKESRVQMELLNSEYIGFNRVWTQLSNGIGRGEGGFKRLYGSEVNIKDLMLNIQENIDSNVRKALQTRAKNKLLRLIIKNHNETQTAKYLTIIPSTFSKVKVLEEELRSKIKQILEDNQIGNMVTKIDEDNEIENTETEIEEDNEIENTETEIEIDEKYLDFWQIGIKPKMGSDGTYVDSAVIDGKRKYFEYKDPLLIDMLLNLNHEKPNLALSILYGIKNSFTRMVVLGLQFIEANLVRDTIGAFLLTKSKNYLPFFHSLKGMGEFIIKSEDYKNFKRGGGGYSSRLEGMTKVNKSRNRIKYKKLSYYEMPQRLLSLFDHYSSSFEYGTRIAEYNLSKKEGNSESESVFRGTEVSNNFSIHGSSQFFTAIVNLVPFLQASIQALDRVYREALVSKKYDGDPLLVFTKGLLGITIPSLLLYMFNKNNDEYNDIPQEEKDLYIHIPIGNGRFFKIAMPYEVGFVYKTLPELTMKYIEDENGSEFANQFVWSLTTMFGVNVSPAFANGWYNIATNTSWTGKHIIPSYLKGIEPSEQYTPFTSNTFVNLGKTINVSPIKAEYMFNAYTSYLGGYILSLSDDLLWNKEKYGEKPVRDISSNIFLNRFITPKTRHSTQSIEDFFTLKDASDLIKKTYTEVTSIGRLEKESKIPKKLFEDGGITGYTIKQKQFLFSINKEFTKIQEQSFGKKGLTTLLIEITFDTNMLGKEKTKKINELLIERNKNMRNYVKIVKKQLKEIKNKE